jgi:cell division protein FtsI/penicillin-binding protein 2
MDSDQTFTDYYGFSATSRAIVDGKYSINEYNAFYVGFTPRDKPKYIVFVIVSGDRRNYLNSPYYGSTIAKPYFLEISEFLAKSYSSSHFTPKVK